MTKIEENWLSMYMGVLGVLENAQDIISQIPAFKQGLQDLQHLMSEIREKDNIYLTKSKGATATKRETRFALSEVLVAVSSALYVFAKKSDDHNLMALSKVTKTSLKNMRDTELLHKASSITERVKANQAELRHYGLSSERIEELEDRVSAYQEASANQGVKQAEKKAARKRLTELFEEANNLLSENLDYMIELVKANESGLYGKYQAARVIKNL